MTATWNGHTVPDDLWNAIIGGAYGSAEHAQIPPALLVALSWHECAMVNQQSQVDNVNPRYNAPNGREASYGYLQLLNQGGVGDGYTADQLLDPSTNLYLARNAILQKLHAGADLTEAIYDWSTSASAIADYLAHPIVTVTGF